MSYLLEAKLSVGSPGIRVTGTREYLIHEGVHLFGEDWDAKLASLPVGGIACAPGDYGRAWTIRRLA